jgi:hypothetical protein
LFTAENCAGIGYVLDRTKIDVPYATFFAAYSGGEYAPSGEGTKEDAGLGLQPSKFTQKKGVMQRNSYQTNYAKWNRGTETYLPKGTVENFAEAVWRRYFKRHSGNGIQPYNEALVWKTYGEKNPIKGLIIRIAKVTQQNLQEVLSILKENPQLKLYLYDENAKKHIITFCNNTIAQTLLISLQELSGDTLKKNLKTKQRKLLPLTQDSNENTVSDKKSSAAATPSGFFALTRKQQATAIALVGSVLPPFGFTIYNLLAYAFSDHAASLTQMFSENGKNMLDLIDTSSSIASLIIVVYAVLLISVWAYVGTKNQKKLEDFDQASGVKLQQ